MPPEAEAVQGAAALQEAAPAKINLTLHVTGRRADGYHRLDSLVAFAGVGDLVEATPAPGLSLALRGRAEGIPAGDDNLVLRAARLMQARAPAAPGARLVLEKRLPPASGLGGGSADAAAALRLLARLWGVALPSADEALALGADVPVCLSGRPVRMGGIGERLATCPPLPPAWVVLANPGVETPTAAVFAALATRDNPPMPAALPAWADTADLAGWIAGQRNDLEGPARMLFPVIGAVLEAIAAQPGCLVARMSGSGASCFGLFAGPDLAAAAARRLSEARPAWWVADAALLRAAADAA
jgi:4-diphosphocytidyl-2-C-methyl-D-erythritol kinase